MITSNDGYVALRNALLAMLPGPVEVIRGQVNRVATPKTPDYIVMVEATRVRLATNEASWDGASVTDYKQSTQLRIQLDVHGPNGNDNAQIISTILRSPYGVFLMGSDVTPLYCEDGQQMPFINEANQYEDRWTMFVVLQTNPVISTPQDFATTLTPTLIEVDTTYPESA